MRSNNQLNSLLSRETAFLLNNFLILAILAIVFLFTNYPIFTEWLTDEKGFIGPPIYNQVTGPLFLILILLMGIAPLTMWSHTNAKRLGIRLRTPLIVALVVPLVLFAFGTRLWWALFAYWVVTFACILTLLEFWRGTHARMKSKGELPWVAFNMLMMRNRRRYGGYWIHVGVIVMAFGIISTEFFRQDTQIVLNQGQSITMGAYTLTYLDLINYEGADDLVVTEAEMALYKGGRLVKTLRPRTELYTRSGQPMTIPSARSTIGEDFYVLMINWESATKEAATFRIYINPLINWVWAGGVIFIFGTLIAAWPAAERKRTFNTVTAPTDTPPLRGSTA